MPTPATSSTQSDRIETATHVIHLRPRISATKLAEYVFADPLRQRAILKQSKKALKSMTLRYRNVRDTVRDSFSANGFRANEFLLRALELEMIQDLEGWDETDNKLSVRALRHLAALNSQIEISGATSVTIPQNGSNFLMVAGVRVSIHPSVVFSLIHSGVTKVGGVILNTGKDDGLSLAIGHGKYTSGDYLSTLLHLLLEKKYSLIGPVVHTKCYALDIFREKAYVAPRAHKMLQRHLTAACETIAQLWETVPADITPQTQEVLD